jgi:hypothetical protein
MQRFEVEVVETLRHVLTVEAEDKETARRLAEERARAAQVYHPALDRSSPCLPTATIILDGYRVGRIYEGRP